MRPAACPPFIRAPEEDGGHGARAPLPPAIYRGSCAAGAVTMPPVGSASAVLVDFGAGSGRSALVSLIRRSCTGLVPASATAAFGLSSGGSTSATASRSEE